MIPFNQNRALAAGPMRRLRVGWSAQTARLVYDEIYKRHTEQPFQQRCVRSWSIERRTYAMLFTGSMIYMHFKCKQRRAAPWRKNAESNRLTVRRPQLATGKRLKSTYKKRGAKINKGSPGVDVRCFLQELHFFIAQIQDLFLREEKRRRPLKWVGAKVMEELA